MYAILSESGHVRGHHPLAEGLRFPAREASTELQTMIVTTGDEKLKMTNIVVGDVWVM